jgi:hypothetical protein
MPYTAAASNQVTTPEFGSLLCGLGNNVQASSGGLIWNNAGQGVTNTTPTASIYISSATAATSITYQYFYGSQQIQWPTITTTPATDYYSMGYNPYQYQFIGNNIFYGNNIPESAEQKVAREEQEVKRMLATKRAEDLLLLHLTDEQQAQYLKEGYFETVVNDKTYRINKGRAGNVFLVEKGITKYKYCAHPDDYTPEQDAMLAQLLMLRTDEERFIKTANRTVVG